MTIGLISRRFAAVSALIRPQRTGVRFRAVPAEPTTTRRELSPIVFVILLIGACSNGARREAASLASAVERYRRVENIQKPAEAAVIADVACTDAEVCAAKKACLAMSEPTSKGLALKVEVEKGLADLEAKRISPDSEEARGLAQKLEDSSRMLERGRAALSACDEKVLALRLKYAL